MPNQVKQTVKKVFEDVADAIDNGTFEQRIKIGLTIDGSELGLDVMKQAAYAIKQANQFDVVLIGQDVPWAQDFQHVSTANSDQNEYQLMESLLADGTIDGCVTLHYPFPIGVSTVGKVVTPAFGRELFIATTTGTTSAVRNQAMVLNAVNGIIAAKTMGIAKPTVGILNVEGANTVERALRTLKGNGYDIAFGESQRADGGAILRGNDLLTGSVDVAVCDSLTGNILMKLFSAYASGGQYETLGAGYGPGIGADYDNNICIISRASGVPVIVNALNYAYQLAKGHLATISKQEYAQAKQAQLDQICADLKPKAAAETKTVEAPAKEVVTDQIPGIDVIEMEDAVQLLWQNQIYAESGMGCTGPIILVNEKNGEKARKILKEGAYL